METKVYRNLDFKFGDEPGNFRAVIAHLNVIDKDGDVTEPGAFREGQAVKIAQWGHRWDELPAGKGVIHADQERAWVDGQFFLETTHGRDTWQTIKSLGELAEWSYGFHVDKQGFGEFEGREVRFLQLLDVHEASPVMLAAGIETGTEFVKATWDTAYVNSLPDSAFALILPGGEKDEDGRTVPRSLRKFPHHNAEGELDAPHVRNALARIPQADITEEQRAKALGHLRRHAGSMGIGDAGKADDAQQQTYADHAEAALAAVQGLLERSRSLADLRAKEGRTLSTATRNRLTNHPVALREVADAIDELLKETEPPEKGQPPPDLLSLFLQHQQARARLTSGLFH